MEKQRYRHFLFVLTALSLLPAMISAQTYEDAQIRDEAEHLYLTDVYNTEIYRFFEQTSIHDGQKINGHIVLVRGDLDIHGRVNGDILVLWGDVNVHHTGIVNGDITTVGGKINLLNYGRVNGNMLETHWKNVFSKSTRTYREFHAHNPENYGTLRLPSSDEEFILRYNRVEGTFAGFQVPKRFRDTAGNLGGYGFLGYGFESGAVRYQVGIDRWLFSPSDYRTETGFEVHDLTDTKDLWRVPYVENSLASLFFKEDYHDYFRRRGFSAHFSQNVSRYVKASVYYHSDDYESMARRTNWSVFGGSGRFRENPSLGVYEGTIKSVRAELLVDTRDRLDFSSRGMFIHLNAETSAPGLHSDFDFDRYFGEIRLFQPISYGESIALRIAAGTSFGDLPLQKNFELGGVSTLRGYAFKEFGGTRMFLANLEYRIATDIFGGFPGLDDMLLIPFIDAGQIWSGVGNENIGDSFSPLAFDRLSTNIGLGIGDREGDYRLDIAKRTDRSDNDFVVTFRLNQPF